MSLFGYMYVYVCGVVSTETKKGVEFPGSELAGGCEPLHVGLGTEFRSSGRPVTVLIQ